MKIIIQKVSSASVAVESAIIGHIGPGYVVLVGFETGDTDYDVEKAVQKIVGLRIFKDDKGKMNDDIQAANGSILSVSQFTLGADLHKGNRPSFTEVMVPEEAEILFNMFNQSLRRMGLSVETGVFQADMQVSLVNDGPTTFILAVKDGKVA